jgi:hypothetical protein
MELKKALSSVKPKEVTWIALGMVYGVSDNAVRKWMRAEKLI